MRKGPRDVANERQRTLFGVDRLERHVADITVELLRLVGSDVSRETAHTKRMNTWIELYTELQRSDFELSGPIDEKTEVRSGSEKE